MNTTRKTSLSPPSSVWMGALHPTDRRRPPSFRSKALWGVVLAAVLVPIPATAQAVADKKPSGTVVEVCLPDRSRIENSKRAAAIKRDAAARAGPAAAPVKVVPPTAEAMQRFLISKSAPPPKIKTVPCPPEELKP